MWYGGFRKGGKMESFEVVMKGKRGGGEVGVVEDGGECGGD